ncbi:conserved protein, unknown function [Hepatocystis sp. ex Piliocolobus tephrosceles]|nr:conserved protein, unknown function [Hepatocystis sp. ex Piliocolobus tephrosceles]
MYKIPYCCICHLQLKYNLCVEKACGNVFHYECMERWIEVQRVCPLCKASCNNNGLIRIHYELKEDNTTLLYDELQTKSKNELCEKIIQRENDLNKRDYDLNKIKAEKDICEYEIFTLKNKNKILSDTIEKYKKQVDDEKKEQKKLKETNDGYFKEKIKLLTKMEEYDKELIKYKELENYLKDLNKEDQNKLDVQFGLNILTPEEQKKVILNSVKNYEANEKKNKLTIKELNEIITKKDNEILKLKEKIFTYEINNDSDNNINKNMDNISTNEQNTNNIKIKNKIIRRVKTLHSIKKKKIIDEDSSSSPSLLFNKSKSEHYSNNNSPSVLLKNKYIGLINLVDNVINDSNSHNLLNTTPKKRKTKSIEVVDMIEHSSIDKFFNNINTSNLKTIENMETIETGEPEFDQKNMSPFNFASKKTNFLTPTNKLPKKNSIKKININSKSHKITEYFKRV